MDWKFIVTIFVAVIFGVTAIVQGFKLVRKKKPSWAYQTQKLIGLGSNAPPELKLTFGDVPVKEVFSTKFIFFNNGKEPIRTIDDVIKPITIRFGNAQILREPFIRPSNNEIEFISKRVNDCIEIGFKYLDYQDGAVVEILHTASDRPVCQGKIISTRRISYLGEFETSSFTTLEKVLAGLLIPCLIIEAISIVLLRTHNTIFSSDSSLFGVINFIASATLGMNIPSAIKFFQVSKFPSWSRPPKS